MVYVKCERRSTKASTDTKVYVGKGSERLIWWEAGIVDGEGDCLKQKQGKAPCAAVTGLFRCPVKDKETRWPHLQTPFYSFSYKGCD